MAQVIVRIAADRRLAGRLSGTPWAERAISLWN